MIYKLNHILCSDDVWTVVKLFLSLDKIEENNLKLIFNRHLQEINTDVFFSARNRVSLPVKCSKSPFSLKLL